MEKLKLIEKAKKVIKIFDIKYDESKEPVFTDKYPEILIQNTPDLDEIFMVMFTTLPASKYKYGATITIEGSKKTGKLTRIISKGINYKIPEELQ